MHQSFYSDSWTYTVVKLSNVYGECKNSKNTLKTRQFVLSTDTVMHYVKADLERSIIYCDEAFTPAHSNESIINLIAIIRKELCLYSAIVQVLWSLSGQFSFTHLLLPKFTRYVPFREKFSLGSNRIFFFFHIRCHMLTLCNGDTVVTLAMLQRLINCIYYYNCA